jgi:hypothetical protein
MVRGSAAAMLTVHRAAVCVVAGTEVREYLFVVSERLGVEPGAILAILEEVDDPDRGSDPFDPALHEFQVWTVAQAGVVQSLRLGLQTSPVVGLLSG